ncbi:hypothetical protein PIB30_071858 [Stylosanthes scabra]|uniref:Uncharacterized protein n=1 Tax=Stylosanthes scabra TaxID=79078 RepID=A0ABU6XLR2_9FABA|nr:hypothetical protein [Stylosanthes scabra]
MRPSMIASETDAKVTGSSPSFKISRESAESTQKGGTGRFGVVATFARREPYLDLFRVVIGLREHNLRMGSGIIYYEIEKCEKYEDSDKRADSDLVVVKTPRRRDSSKGRDPSSQRSGSSRRASPMP